MIFSHVNIYIYVHVYIHTTIDLSDVQKGRISLAMGRVDKCLVNGASDTLQLLDATAETMRIIAGN
jgi:hypothetical protein